MKRTAILASVFAFALGFAASAATWFNGGIDSGWTNSVNMTGGLWGAKGGGDVKELAAWDDDALVVETDLDEEMQFTATSSKDFADGAASMTIDSTIKFNTFDISAMPPVPENAKAGLILVKNGDDYSFYGLAKDQASDPASNIWVQLSYTGELDVLATLDVRINLENSSDILVSYQVKAAGAGDYIELVNGESSPSFPVVAEGAIGVAAYSGCGEVSSLAAECTMAQRTVYVDVAGLETVHLVVAGASNLTAQVDMGVAESYDVSHGDTLRITYGATSGYGVTPPAYRDYVVTEEMTISSDTPDLPVASAAAFLVGDQPYETFAAAYAAVDAEGTIKIASASATIPGDTAFDKSFTLDVNGNEFSFTSSGAEISATMIVADSGDGKFTLVNGISVAAGASFDLSAMSGTKLDVSGGTISIGEGGILVLPEGNDPKDLASLFDTLASGAIVQSGDKEWNYTGTAWKNTNFLYQDGEDNYLIADADDFQLMYNFIDAGVEGYAAASYKQTGNVDLSGIEWPGIGLNKAGGLYSVADTIDRSNIFNGTYDGGNFAISNLQFADGKYLGLFNTAVDATIKNLTINTIGMANPSTTGNGCAVLVGDGVRVTFRSVKTDGAVTGTHNLGGFLVKGSGCKFYDCTNSVNLTSSYTKMGGFIAFNSSTKSEYVFENCINEGDITSTADDADSAGVGGFIGADTPQFMCATSTFVNCSNTGAISYENSDRVGAFLGQREVYATASECPYTFTGCSAQSSLRPVGTYEKAEAGSDGIIGLQFAAIADGVATYSATATVGGQYKVTAPDAAFEFTAQGQTLELDLNGYEDVVSVAEGSQLVPSEAETAFGILYTANYNGAERCMVVATAATWVSGISFNDAVVTVTDTNRTVTLVKGTDYTIDWGSQTITPMSAGDAPVVYNGSIVFAGTYAGSMNVEFTWTVNAPSAPAGTVFTVAFTGGTLAVDGATCVSENTYQADGVVAFTLTKDAQTMPVYTATADGDALECGLLKNVFAYDFSASEPATNFVFTIADASQSEASDDEVKDAIVDSVTVAATGMDLDQTKAAVDANVTKIINTGAKAKNAAAWIQNSGFSGGQVALAKSIDVSYQMGANTLFTAEPVAKVTALAKTDAASSDNVAYALTFEIRNGAEGDAAVAAATESAKAYVATLVKASTKLDFSVSLTPSVTATYDAAASSIAVKVELPKSNASAFMKVTK